MRGAGHRAGSGHGAEVSCPGERSKGERGQRGRSRDVRLVTSNR